MTTMRRNYTISNQKGLHARAAAEFVKVASQFEAAITVVRGSTTANGKSIMSLLILAAPKGSAIEVEAQGADAAPALDALGELIDAKFREGS